MKTRMTALLLVIMIMAAGCATYKARSVVPMSTKQKGTVKIEKEDAVIRAFPILNKDDSEKYFDENLLSDYILAIFLEVFNKSSNEVKVVSLELKIDKIVLQPSTTDEMYKVVKREYAVKTFLWALPTWFVGAPISAIHTYRINKEIEKDIKGKELSKEIKPFGTSGGFIWFKIPKKVAPEYKNKGLPKGTILSLILEQEKRVVEYKLIMP